MKTPEQLEKIKEYEEDIFDCEKQVKQAGEELAIAKEWSMRQKVYHAEAIIRLNNYLKSL